ncbi:DUF3592 domain-containing protein [Phytopseudomonas dryadis]|uniref:DUF3592 domain-containing protein n=1 Tax=Phytopseudomonas dryadis TaxID=2487520 RepID=A0A4Q9QT20_9GAMM|nr:MULTISPECIES: DUF3592 domain-containing protein [Pseudomonas]TBU85601.1 DUF3592 domain-containing protein [Pseudomonas dryadis]TBU99476.1 DUF3592 domain-containing protein [Pseudomonas dryadis]TBV12542.1 DUF3592 domain-containing protein [Pseudomonas sp. FRB 230]
MKTGWVWIFPGIGALLLVIAIGIQVNRIVGEARMAPAQGSVVDIEGGCPTVSFVTQDGTLGEYHSNTCSHPPAFAIGERVALYYDPQDPQRAHIDSFGQNWAGSLIVGGIGLVFLLIGLAIVLPPLFGKRRSVQLLATGTPVQAEVVDVELNETLTINGRNPYRIVAQWLNPQTNKLHVFRSANLWFDPGPYISDSQVTVMIDPNKPRRYSMDIRFLPELVD